MCIVQLGRCAFAHGNEHFYMVAHIIPRPGLRLCWSGGSSRELGSSEVRIKMTAGKEWGTSLMTHAFIYWRFAIIHSLQWNSSLRWFNLRSFNVTAFSTGYPSTPTLASFSLSSPHLHLQDPVAFWAGHQFVLGIQWHLQLAGHSFVAFIAQYRGIL